MFQIKRKRHIKKAFYAIAGNDKLIDCEEWKSALGQKNNILVERMFALVDRDNSGYIDLDEFGRFAKALLSSGFNKRLKLVFWLCDINSDGLVSWAELDIIIGASLKAQGLHVSGAKVVSLIDSFFDNASKSRKAADVIRMDPQSNQAYIAYQDDCQICHLCRLSCPVDAITLTPDKAIKPTVSWG